MSFTDIPVSHGRLEGILWAVDAPKAAVVVCHPHPLHGGTMHNHVTYRIADAFRKNGAATLRFNFRGVGRSTGTHDDGRGEIDDGKAALDVLGREVPDVPLYIAGFSFGSRVAMRLSVQDPRVEKVMLVGMALRLYSFDALREVKKPKAILHAEHDEFAPVEQARELFETLEGPKRFWMVPGSDHLATGKLEEFSVAADEAAAWLLGA